MGMRRPLRRGGPSDASLSSSENKTRKNKNIETHGTEGQQNMAL
jgi:hypothetical protein